MASDQWADLPAKLGRLQVLANRRDLQTIVLRDPANLGWLLGCRVNVPQTLDTACLDVIVDLSTTPPRISIVTNAIEAPRLRDTELVGLDADWVVIPWWASRDEQLPRGATVGSDRPLSGSAPLADNLSTLRRPLTGHQSDLLQAVCHDTACAATDAAGRLNPAMTEFEAAAVLAKELLTRELDPIVLMVGGQARLQAHRHPLPTSKPLGRRAMLVACGRRHALVSSITRIVSFEPLTSAEEDAYRRLLHVEEAFLDATVVDAPIGDAFTSGITAYVDQGFDPKEWHRHHQGGFSGFQPREFPASASSSAHLTEGAVVAWNPSADGWKVEDTCLVLRTGAQPLVHDETWPTTKVGTRLRPDVLVP